MTDYRIGLSWVNHVRAPRTNAAASTEVGDLSAENARDPRVGRRWRLLEPFGWWQADFLGNRPIEAVALRFPRDLFDQDGEQIMPQGQVRHLFDADGGLAGTGSLHTSPFLPVGALKGYGYHLYRTPSLLQARHWRVEFDVTTSVDLGLAWAGELWRPQINFALGWGEAMADLSAVAENPRSGARFTDQRGRRRVLDLTLANILPGDRETAREMQRIAGISRQVLAVIEPNADPVGREIVIGRFTAADALRQPFFGAYARRLPIVEDL